MILFVVYQFEKINCRDSALDCSHWWLAGPDKWAWTTLLRGDKDKEEGELWRLAENRPQICLGIVVVVVVKACC